MVSASSRGSQVTQVSAVWQQGALARIPAALPSVADVAIGGLRVLRNLGRSRQ